MLTILVVDDSRVQCDHAVALCRQLQPGAVVEACHNGAEALVLLRKQRFDVVVLDLEMPVMDGVELASQIAAGSLAAAVVIVSSKDPSLIASVSVGYRAISLPDPCRGQSW